MTTIIRIAKVQFNIITNKNNAKQEQIYWECNFDGRVVIAQMSTDELNPILDIQIYEMGH